MSNHTTEAPVGDPPPGDPAEGVGAACEHALECWLQENVLLARLVGTLLVILAAWVVLKVSERALTRSARRYARHRRMDDYQTKAIVGRTRPMRLVIALVVFVVSVIIITAIWGLMTAFAGLLAGAGFLGIVVGLAAAESLGNMVAGFLIFYNHPFEIGDWVDIEGVEGMVEDVALAATTITTWDNEKMTLPNRFVANAKVRNFTAARKLRRRLVVGVEYGSHLGLAMKTLVDLAKAHPEVLRDPEPTAVAHGFGNSSVDLVLRFYVEPVRSNAIKVYTDLLHQVHDTFRAKGLRIAFPHMQVVQGPPWRLEGEPVGGPGATGGPGAEGTGAQGHEAAGGQEPGRDPGA